MVDRGVLNILLRIQTIGFFKILLVVKHNLLYQRLRAVDDERAFDRKRIGWAYSGKTLKPSQRV